MGEKRKDAHGWAVVESDASFEGLTLGSDDTRHKKNFEIGREGSVANDYVCETGRHPHKIILKWQVATIYRNWGGS